MRKIRFRGYNAKNKQWLYGFYIENRLGHFVCPNEFACGKDWDDYEVSEETVGQFTGISDEKGTEIYEGDKLSDGSTIEWIDTGFTIHTELGHFPLWKCNIEGLHVTGNIYDVKTKENKI